jgi:hypothetical protein
MKRRMSRPLLGVVAAAACGSAGAHHSYAQFETCKRVAIEGAITGVEWANPHVLITVRTADEGSYRIEWSSLQQLGAMGVSTDQLRTGDHVVITGSAHRDPAVKVVTLLTEIRKPSDGWMWTRDRPIPENCKQR